MNKPTLFVLAAGLGNKYGGMKQQVGIGPHGETILDYSIYDAYRSGFGKVVFVLFSSFEKEFIETIYKRYDSILPVDYILLDKEFLQEEISLKSPFPWSSICALWAGRKLLQEGGAFGVINGEDFYGRESFSILYDTIMNMDAKASIYANVAFQLQKTICETSPVTRGICIVDENNNLKSIVDYENVEWMRGNLVYDDIDRRKAEIKDESLTSMNMWALTPRIFEQIDPFLKNLFTEKGLNTKAPYTITQMINNLIEEGKVVVQVKQTPSEWLGFTCEEDRVPLILKMNEFIKAQIYPKKLWA